MARRHQTAASGHTILAVDDQPETLVSAEHLLGREGHRVLTAASGEEALAILREQPVHVMIVDYFMPRMNGAELVERVRRFDPIVQIILQTGYSGEKPPRQMLRELDIQGYHDKADDPERLLQWVQVALRSYGLLTKLQERERLQQELVASCSHEFRTPLNIIGGYAELLSSGYGDQLDESARRAVDLILDATRGLSDLVTDFLTYAKLQARAVDVTPQEIDVRQLADELQAFGTALADEKPLYFGVTLGALAAPIVADPVKLRTVLRNLIANAIKFTARGEVTVTITADGTATRFAVTDTGCGIPAAKLDRVFDPFEQVGGANGRNTGGVGLGLAICRKTATLLGGTLSVESREGEGSTFTFLLPPPAAEAQSTAVDDRR